jgi:integrase/recombinase XerD
VSAADVFEFLADQRGDRTVVRLADRESGLSARTIARRPSSVSGLYAYLVARGDTPVQVNPVRPFAGYPLTRPTSCSTSTADCCRQHSMPHAWMRAPTPAEPDLLPGAAQVDRARA